MRKKARARCAGRRREGLKEAGCDRGVIYGREESPHGERESDSNHHIGRLEGHKVTVTVTVEGVGCGAVPSHGWSLHCESSFSFRRDAVHP